MKQLHLHKGNFSYISTNKAAKGLFNMRKWYKKMANLFNIPFVDDCCDAPVGLPVRINATTGLTEFYNPTTDAWEVDATGNSIPGELKAFAGSTPPAGWAFADGSLQAINTYPALFDAIGATFGGDGLTTFALPDTRGRVLAGAGTGTLDEVPYIGMNYIIRLV